MIVSAHSGPVPDKRLQIVLNGTDADRTFERMGQANGLAAT